MDDGHVDYAARLSGGKLRSLVKDGSKAGSATWREPSAVVFHVKPEAATKVPSGFGFLGNAGATIWQIPQTQKQGVLWLGWNTEELSAAQVGGSGVTWSLDKVDGPGALAIYEYGTFGQPTVIFNSGDGVPDTYTIPLGTHAHGNWAFTKEGTYKITLTHSATLASGARSTDTEVVTFAVGNVDPTSAQSARTRPMGYAIPLGALPARAAACRGRLPFTGGQVLVPAALGTGLLSAGAATIGLSLIRRRRNGASAEA